MNATSAAGQMLSEIALFKELTEILHRETECLVSRDSAGLSETIERARLVADRIEELGMARGRVLGVAQPSAGNGTSRMEAAEVSRHHGVLLALIDGAREINRINRVALRGALEEMLGEPGAGKHPCADCACAAKKPGDDAHPGDGCACASGF
jgi:hypothetical protein